MLTEMLDKINRYLEEREEKKYQKHLQELEKEYGDPEKAPEATYEEVEVNDNEDPDEVDMNIQDSIYEETTPVNEEIEMNIQEPIEEEIDMNVMPKKKKGIRSFFQNLKKNKKETTSTNEEIDMNIQEPIEEEIDMNVMPKKKKSIRSFFQNLKKNKKETTSTNEEIDMNIQEPVQEEIDMNVMPKKKKGIRSFFQNLKKNKKEATSTNEEIDMNIQEPTEEEIDMNVIPKKKKSIRGIFQNLKAKVMKKSNSRLKASTTKMDIVNATLFTIIQSIVLTGTIVVGVMNPAVGFLAGVLAFGCSLAVIADIKDVVMKVKKSQNSQPVQEESHEELNEESEQDMDPEKVNTKEPIISYSFTKNGPEIAEVDLSNIHTEPGLHINQELFGFKNEPADIKHFVVNREDEEVNNYVANEIENITGMEPIYADYNLNDEEKRVYVLTR